MIDRMRDQLLLLMLLLRLMVLLVDDGLLLVLHHMGRLGVLTLVLGAGGKGWLIVRQGVVVRRVTVVYLLQLHRRLWT